jgi:hypothetical protein
METPQHRIESLSVGEINRRISARLSELAMLKEKRILKLQEQKETVQPYTGRYRELHFAGNPALYRPPRKSRDRVADTLPPDDYIVGELDTTRPDEPLVTLTPKRAPHLSYTVYVDETLEDVPISEVLATEKRYPTPAEAEAWNNANAQFSNEKIAKK